MITCPNCLKKHENGTTVCDECGYDLLVTAKKRAATSAAYRKEDLDNAAKENSAEDDASAEELVNEEEADSSSKAAEPYLDINDEDDDMPYDAYRYQKVKNPRKIRRFNKTAFRRIVCICLAVALFVTSLVFLLNYLFGEKQYPKYVMYVQNGDLKYYGIDGKKSSKQQELF